MTRETTSPLGRLRAALDAWLWRRGIREPAIRALLCSEAGASVAALMAGALLLAVTPWIFWFGAGLASMTWIFWNWARFFSRPGGGVEPGALAPALIRWVLRLLVFALALYLALRIGASLVALAAGVAAGVAVGLMSYARSARRPGLGQNFQALPSGAQCAPGLLTKPAATKITRGRSLAAPLNEQFSCLSVQPPRGPDGANRAKRGLASA